MGERISDQRFKDTMVQNVTTGDREVKMTTCRGSELGLEEVDSTVRSMYLHDMSRSNENRMGAAGCRAAMAAESARGMSHIICYSCSEKGHFKSDGCALTINKGRRNSSDGRQRRGKVTSGGCAGQTWCSFHNCTTHNQSHCRAQRKPGQDASESYAATAPLSAISPPDGIEEDSEFDGGFMWIALTGAQTSPS